jgi:NodT family efflux transporter outer membrane factor (OMF) lipoprotein
MKRILMSGAFATGAFALVGCNLAPEYKIPSTPPVTQQTFREAGAWTQGTPQDTFAKGEWWKVYNDMTLSGLESQLDSSNPNLAAALARNDQAQAFVREAESAFFPLVTTSDGVSTNKQSANRPLRSATQPNYYGADTLGATVSYELDVWGAIRDQVAAGKAEAQGQAAETAFVKLSLEATLANSYFSLRESDARTQLLTQTVDGYGRALTMTEQRHSGGIASGLDVGRAQTQLSDAKAQLSQAKAQRALYEHAIASLVGVPATTFSIAAENVDFKIPNVPAGVPSALLQRRPDVAAAERAVVAANANIGVARAAFFPTLSLGATGGVESTQIPGLISAPNLFWTLGPNAAMTLFDAGAHQAELDIAKAERNEAAGNYRAEVLQAFQDVEDNLALLNHLASAAKDEADAVTAADRTEDLSLARYRLGAVNYLDVVVAQAAALSAQLSALDIEALGGGWTVDDLPKTDMAAVTPKAKDTGR